MGGFGLAMVVSFGLCGCGSAGMDEGLPQDLTPGVPLDPKMTDMTGASFADQKKAQSKNAAAAKNAPAPPPAPEKSE